MKIFLIFNLANLDYFTDQIIMNGIDGIPDGIHPDMDALELEFSNLLKYSCKYRR